MPRKNLPPLNGWTLARQRRFVEVLSQCGSVTKAAAEVGLSASSAYRLRARNEHSAFRIGWEAAMATAVQSLEDSAMERATLGEEKPLYSKGEVVGTQRVFDNKLAVFLLQMNKRHRSAITYTRPPEERWTRPLDDFGALLECFGDEGDPSPPSV